MPQVADVCVQEQLEQEFSSSEFLEPVEAMHGARGYWNLTPEERQSFDEMRAAITTGIGGP